MQYTTCDFPGCDFKSDNKGLVRPLGMVNVEVRVEYNQPAKRFDLCALHAKALGLDTESKPTIENELLQILAEFVQDVTTE